MAEKTSAFLPDPEQPEAELREKAGEIVRRLPRYAIPAVIREVDVSAASNSGRARAFRKVLIDHCNKMRPMKARRLFTTAFEPLLTDDPILYHSRDSVPGLFQRVDVGGVWSALTRSALRSIAADVQKELDNLSSDALVDTIFSKPEALAMRAAMAREAIRCIEGLSKNRKALDEFLGFANREALRDAKLQSPVLTQKAPIDAPFLMLMAAVLREGAPILTVLAGLRRELPEAGTANSKAIMSVDRASAVILAASRDLAVVNPNRGPLDTVRWLPALIGLNVKRRYDVTLRVIRDMASSATVEDHPLHRAVYCHFGATCSTIADTMRAIFTRDALKLGQAVSLPHAVRNLLRDAMWRFSAALGVLSNGGLLAVRTIGPRIRPALAEVSNAIEDSVVPLCIERLVIALNARNEALSDQEDLIWLLVFLSEWRSALSAAGYSTPDVDNLRDTLLKDAEAAFTHATRLDVGDDPRRRMDHIVRINAILAGIGASIAHWANPMSQGSQAIIHHYLRSGQFHEPEVEFVIECFMRAVRAELRRSKHWQSAELAELIALYEARPPA